MEQIISGFEGALSYVVPMAVLLGLLIFVHELGHFLVAKYFKVRVEVFSLGFGPKILKFKRGDTTYALSLVPLGGYVKMFGDDPSAEISADQREHSFLHKPVGQRIAVVLAGPLMNFFFAILIFSVIAILGEQALAPSIGDVEKTSAAFAAGFRAGDTVISANDQTVQSWDQLQHVIENNASSRIPVVVQHEGGEKQTLDVVPKLIPNKTVMSWDRYVGDVDGLSFSSRSSHIGVRNPKSPAGVAGMKTGDGIKSINGVAVTKWRDVSAALAKAADGKSNPSDVITFGIERGLLDEKKEEPQNLSLKVSVPKTLIGKDGAQLESWLGIEFPELFLASTEKKSPADVAGLRVGDRLVSIDGKKVESFEQVASIIHSFGEKIPDKSATPPLNIMVSRDGEEKTFKMIPNAKTRMSKEGKEERHLEIGIRPLVVEAAPATVQLQGTTSFAALTRGVEQTMRWTSLTVLSFVRLFQAEVSPKNIGGFLSIGQMAKKSWQIGPSQFLNIMAIISINLFILNLLPVPVLDGGHLVFYSIEAIKGAPLSMKKMEIAQQVGLVLLLGLMVFALFNDVTRIFN